MGYKEIIITAFTCFPIIAALFTIPFVIHNYHKYGSVLWPRIIIVYSFILYLITAYFLIILPLPSIETVSNLTTPTMQLIPFSFIKDIITNTAFRINDFKTYLSFFKEPWVYQVLYNICLTIPFGIFIRYYFKKSMKMTCFLTFLLSLFFELTQLSGLYFIYPRAYRLFDVDDLIINTFGGFLGYILTPLVCVILPSKEKIDEKSYEKGTKVSFTKRLVSLFIDLFICGCLIIIAYGIISNFNIEFNEIIMILIIITIYFISLEIIFKGQTIGKKITKIKIVNNNDTNTKFYKYILRYILFMIEMFFVSGGLMLIFEDNLFGIDQSIIAIFILLYFILLMILFVLFIIRNLILRRSYLYERFSSTKIISTIKVPDNKNEANAK